MNVSQSTSALARLDQSSVFVIVLVLDMWALELWRQAGWVHCDGSDNLFVANSAHSSRPCPFGDGFRSRWCVWYIRCGILPGGEVFRCSIHFEKYSAGFNRDRSRPFQWRRRKHHTSNTKEVTQQTETKLGHIHGWPRHLKRRDPGCRYATERHGKILEKQRWHEAGCEPGVSSGGLQPRLRAGKPAAA